MIARVSLLLLGAIAIMMFATVVLVLIPEAMLSRVPAPPQLQPYTGSVAVGRAVYIREGCLYCHSQQVRDASITSDAARGWGRPTVPSDYTYDAPHLLGTSRTGPDLVHVGARLPDRTWHLLHLYQPRALVDWSIMPAFPYLFAVVRPGEEGEAEVVNVPAPWAPPGGGVVVATAEGSALVDYLLSLNRGYPPLLEATDAD